MAEKRKTWDWLRKQYFRLAKRIRHLAGNSTDKVGDYNVMIMPRTLRGLKRQMPEGKFQHVMELCLRLAEFRRRIAVADLDIETSLGVFGDVHILRDMGGPLGSSKVQLMFFEIPSRNEIIILKCYSIWSRYLPSEIYAALTEEFSAYLIESKNEEIALPVQRYLRRLAKFDGTL